MHAKTRRMLAMRSAKKSRHRQRNGNGAPPRRISATRSSHKTAMPLCSQDLVAARRARPHHHTPRKAEQHAAPKKHAFTCTSNKKRRACCSPFITEACYLNAAPHVQRSSCRQLKRLGKLLKRLFGNFAQCAECCFIMNCHVRKHLTIKLYTGFFQTVHELRIRNAV